MARGPLTEKSDALARLESPLEQVFSKDDPYYWPYLLERTGKLRQSPALVQEAIENAPASVHAPILKFVAKRLMTRENCLLAVQKCGENLRYVPLSLCDAEMCRQAVQENGVTAASKNFAAKANHDHVFSVEVETGKITNQKKESILKLQLLYQ